jgi:UDP-N-acetylglucosamine 1-carboxyvinyltransferase
MDDTIITIDGQHVLEGEVSLSGAKNAALPMIVAACLGKEPTILDNVPVELNDVQLLIELMQDMGASITVSGKTLRCWIGSLSTRDVPAHLASSIRYSLLLLGVYAGLRSEIFLPQPGGCKLGNRKYDLHLHGLRMLGAHIEDREDGIYLRADQLLGSQIDFYLPTTSGSENIMIAGVLAEGKTLLRNANTRPEVMQLGELLSAMGANIRVQSRVVEIEGVSSLRGGAYIRIMSGPDEAVSYITAAAATNGEIVIKDFNLNHIKEDARYLRGAGVDLFEHHGNVYVGGKKEKLPFDLFTAPYPGVNSDLQPIFAALALTIAGTSTITDLRFTDRFQYVDKLKQFGGDIEYFGNTAIICGGRQLQAAKVDAPDIRGGMACVLCGLVAQGRTTIGNIYQVERGYENFVEKLSGLGASIEKV